MKLQKISQNITPFAGISFVTEEFNNCGLAKLIDSQLGSRCFTGYQYSEIFCAWFSIFLSGGDVAEDISCHLREGLESIPGNRVPSADTLPRGIKELATENETVVSSSGKQHQFNINLRMNRLNLGLLLLTGQLEEGKYYDFGWGHLPCSDMNHNTVYLVLTAMMKNFHNHFITKVSKAFKDIPANSRLKKFIFRFIAVSGKWVKQSKQWKLRLYTDKPYEKLHAS